MRKKFISITILAVVFFNNALAENATSNTNQQQIDQHFQLALKYKPNLITEYEAIIKVLRKLGNDLMADDFEEKLQILKNNS